MEPKDSGDLNSQTKSKAHVVGLFRESQGADSSVNINRNWNISNASEREKKNCSKEGKS